MFAVVFQLGTRDENTRLIARLGLRMQPQPSQMDVVAGRAIDAERLLPGLPAIFRRKVEEIDRLAEREPGRAQQVIKTALQAEAIRLWPSADGSHLRAEYEIEPARLATGSVSVCAGFETCLLRIPRKCSG